MTTSLAPTPVMAHKSNPSDEAAAAATAAAEALQAANAVHNVAAEETVVEQEAAMPAQQVRGAFHQK